MVGMLGSLSGLSSNDRGTESALALRCEGPNPTPVLADVVLGWTVKACRGPRYSNPLGQDIGFGRSIHRATGLLRSMSKDAQLPVLGPQLSRGHKPSRTNCTPGENPGMGRKA